MAQILLVPFQDRGHAEPLCTLADGLADRGHDVTIFGTPGAMSFCRSDAVDRRHPARWSPTSPVPRETLLRADTTSGASAVVRHLFFGSVHEMALDVRDAARSLGTGCIVSDTFMPGGGLAAELIGLPWISYAGSPVPCVAMSSQYLDDEYRSHFGSGDVRLRLGLPPGSPSLLDAPSPDAHLIPVTPRIAGQADLPPQSRLVGPLLGDLDDSHGIDTDTKTARVLVTSTTVDTGRLRQGVWYREQHLRSCVDGLGGGGVTVLLSITDSEETLHDGQTPSNVHWLGSDHHERWLAGVDTVITHGGWGTIARALRRGIPLLFLPSIHDQMWISHRCAELGVGIALSPDDVTPDRIRTSVRRLLNEPSYRDRAAEVGRDIEELRPVETAIQIIEHVLDTHERTTI